MVHWSWIPTTICYHEPKVHDHELYFQLSRINLYLLLPLAVLGLIFNASALACLYSKPKIASGVFIYLRALLILDHCQLIMTSTTLLMPQLCDNHHSQNHTLYKFCMFERRFLKYTMPRIESTVNTMHVWTIAALSAHRYWKISRPVIARIRDTVAKAHLILTIMLCVIVLYRSPTFFIELQVKWKPTLRIQRRPETTEFLSPYRFVFHTLLDPMVAHLVPFVWMSVFSLLTLYEIFRSRGFTYSQLPFEFGNRSGQRRSLTSCFQNRAEGARQRQELRATISIVLIIFLYLVFHSLQIYNVVRKWQLLLNGKCPTRSDYLQSEISNVLSMFSASVNAFVFIAFTNRLRSYVQMLIRKTSRTLSNSSDPPLSPRTTATVDNAPHSGRPDLATHL